MTKGQSEPPFPILSADLQIAFYFRLNSIRQQYLAEALRDTVEHVEIRRLDSELRKFAPAAGLKKLAAHGLRGELVFPVPVLLKASPSLLGYYRLLFGLSQKEFYSKGPFGRFKRLEELGELAPKTEPQIESLCESLCAT